ncbi:hypothetical protein [Crenobacter intestini]|uniref:DUF1849 family protein n=1 Tax=Crenobacter intestini TaxID=2563443 RepID=A0A4T0URJ8_9NEIS|nr:hypothetical protein [Crenobacter intestini]TIC81347.1 hypothetical protein E5K04_10520 [Crenobacter intestini]
MRKIVAIPFAVAGVFVLASSSALAGAQQRHTANSQLWKPHGEVSGAEYKFQLDGKYCADPAQDFKKVWAVIRGEAEKAGFPAGDVKKLKLRQGTKDYLDTPADALKHAGFIIRVNTRYEDGIAENPLRVSVKTSGKDAAFVLGTSLFTLGTKGKISAEDNPSLGQDGVMVSNVEKGVDLKLAPSQFEGMTLGEFARYVPDLKKSGLPGNTKLEATRAYYRSATVGKITLGMGEAEAKLEAWSRTADGAPMLCEFSYGYEDVDYFKTPELVEAGDAFYRKVVLSPVVREMQLPGFEKFGGSKTRLLRSQPL